MYWCTVMSRLTETSWSCVDAVNILSPNWPLADGGSGLLSKTSVLLSLVWPLLDLNNSDLQVGRELSSLPTWTFLMLSFVETPACLAPKQKSWRNTEISQSAFPKSWAGSRVLFVFQGLVTAAKTNSELSDRGRSWWWSTRSHLS